MRLYEEALVQYDELDAVDTQRVKADATLKWFPDDIMESPHLSLIHPPQQGNVYKKEYCGALSVSNPRPASFFCADGMLNCVK
jgi:hypothetical protein